MLEGVSKVDAISNADEGVNDNTIGRSVDRQALRLGTLPCSIGVPPGVVVQS